MVGPTQSGRATLLNEDDEAIPAFVVDLAGTILEWNAASAQLLGTSAGQVRGRKCWTVLDGLDVNGGRVCMASCSALTAAQGKGSVPASDASVVCRSPEGRARRKLVRWNHVLVTATSGAASAQGAILHVMDDVGTMRRYEFAGRVLLGNASLPPPAGEPLTKREAEVVSLLVEGLTTRDIAGNLGISEVTVRNHVARALPKLGARTRTAAIREVLRREAAALPAALREIDADPPTSTDIPDPAL
jgi:DNA-binding CsgD family transcriptional regulator